MGTGPSRDTTRSANGWGDAPAVGVPVKPTAAPAGSHVRSVGVAVADSSEGIKNVRYNTGGWNKAGSNTGNAIFEEVYLGDLAAVKRRLGLDRGVVSAGDRDRAWLEANKRREDGSSPLHLAAAKGQVEILRALLEAGAELELEDKAGWRALHFAAAAGQRAAAEALLAAGAQPSVFTCDPNSSKPPQSPYAMATDPALKQLLRFHGADSGKRKGKDSEKPIVKITKTVTNVVVFAALGIFVLKSKGLLDKPKKRGLRR